MDAIEVRADAERMLEASPEGLSSKDVARRLGLPERSIHEVIGYLEGMGVGKWIRRPDRTGGRYVPNDWSPPAWDLTANQRSVCLALAARANAHSRVSMSFKDISNEANVPAGSITAHLDALQRKGYLEMLQAGCGTNKSVFHVHLEGDGPQGYRSMDVSQAKSAKTVAIKTNDEEE